MALSKKDLRSVMTAFAWTTTDMTTAHTFINELTRSQQFKREQAMRNFVTNARIFYSNHWSQQQLMKKDSDIDDVYKWQQVFIYSEIICSIC